MQTENAKLIALVRNVLCAILLVTGTTSFGADETRLSDSPAPPEGRRTTFFISDMHLGLGHVAQDPKNGAWTEGGWHPMEDFRWQDEFDRFLTAIERRVKNSGNSADLVILGDFLELWQTPLRARDCVYDLKGNSVSPANVNAAAIQKNLSCNEADAFKRLDRVLGAHGPTFNRIKTFSEVADNRVTIVPGNHDAALVFPSLAKALLDKIGAQDARVRIATEGYWRSADGMIFAEHGHFIKGDVNSYDREPASCLDVSGAQISCTRQSDKVPFLKRPWGEQFVQSYYNEYEEQYSIIDNITNESYGVKIAASEGGLPVVINALVNGFKFLFFQQSDTQFGDLLGDGANSQMLGAGDPKAGWNTTAVKALGDRFLVESLFPDDPIRADMERAVSAGQLTLGIDQLSEDELKELCDHRAARRAEQLSGARLGPLIEFCPGGTTLGAIKTNILTTNAERKSSRLEAVRKSLPDNQRPTKDFGLYVYAHTHAAHGACQPNALVAKKAGTPLTWNPTIVNTGAWQRLVTSSGYEQLRKGNPKKPLRDYEPSELPACYSVVVVPPYQKTATSPASKPSPGVWFWRQHKNGTWDFSLMCERDPQRLPKDACAG